MFVKGWVINKIYGEPIEYSVHFSDIIFFKTYLSGNVMCYGKKSFSTTPPPLPQVS